MLPRSGQQGLHHGLDVQDRRSTAVPGFSSRGTTQDPSTALRKLFPDVALTALGGRYQPNGAAVEDYDYEDGQGPPTPPSPPVNVSYPPPVVYASNPPSPLLYSQVSTCCQLSAVSEALILCVDTNLGRLCVLVKGGVCSSTAALLGISQSSGSESELQNNPHHAAMPVPITLPVARLLESMYTSPDSATTALQDCAHAAPGQSQQPDLASRALAWHMLCLWTRLGAFFGACTAPQCTSPPEFRRDQVHMVPSWPPCCHIRLSRL